MSPDCFRKCGRQLELGLWRWRNEGLGCYKLLSYENDQHHWGHHFSPYNVNTQSREIVLRIILRKCIEISLEKVVWKLNWGFNIRNQNFVCQMDLAICWHRWDTILKSSFKLFSWFSNVAYIKQYLRCFSHDKYNTKFETLISSC